MEEIGRGAMGEVYKARDRLIGRLVALKVITSGKGGRPELLERFYQEARSAGALQHPNIVTVYELGKEGDLPFIAMEFLGGESLDKMIARQEAVPLPTKVAYIAKICRALEYAHKHGVVHRDIKPGNIMLTAEGSVKVVDFGVARLVDASKTQTGTLIGTLGYMSPQQLRGERADERSDIWAVGVLFYELLAYERPFTGDNPAALVLSIISKELTPLRGQVADCTAGVEAIIFRMLEKEAVDRYQSMDEVLLDLEPELLELQRGQVDQMIAESERLAEAGDLRKAQQLLREVLYTDPTRQDAKVRLDQLSRELRRQQVQPHVHDHLVKARSAIDSGQWQQAEGEAQAALQLDSTCQPARELIAEAEKAIERAREIEKRLWVTKQRVATGSLTEADALIGDLLSMDPQNREAQELRSQVRGEFDRREKRKQRETTLKRARDLWSQLRYEQCITLLKELQKTAPEDPEVAKLLETARGDQAERRKQQNLTKARNLLAAGQHDNARSVLNALLAEFPADAAAQKLLTLLEDEERAKSRQAWLQSELVAMRALVAEGKHGEAVHRGEELLAEFPREFELAEMVNFSRAEARRAEQARLLEERIGQVRKLIGKGSLAEAIRLANQALTDAPRNANLLSLRESAMKKQKEKERREELNKRIREVRARIGRNELTDAIEMAKETLVRLGPNADVSLLLQAAEGERKRREKKKEQQEQVEAAHTLLQTGKTEEATQILNEAIATQLLDATDPRVRTFFDEVERRKTQQETIASSLTAPPVPPTTASSVPDHIRGEPSNDYIVQTPPTQLLPPAPSGEMQPQDPLQATAFSATNVGSPSIESPSNQPIPPPLVPSSLARPPREKKVQPATEDVQGVARHPAPSTATSPAAVLLAVAKRRLPVAIATVAAAVVIGIGLYFALGNHREAPQPATTVPSSVPITPSPAPSAPRSKLPAALPPQPPINTAEQQQRQLIDQAHQLMVHGDLAGALQKADQGLKLKGPLTQDLRKLQTQVQKTMKEKLAAAALRKENRLWAAGRAAFDRKNYTVAERDFRQLAAMNNAKRKSDAENYLKNLIPPARAVQQRARSDREKLSKLIGQFRHLGATVDPLDPAYGKTLQKLQSQFRSLESVSGPVGQQAKDYAEQRISTQLSNLAGLAASARPIPTKSSTPVAPATVPLKHKMLWGVSVENPPAHERWSGQLTPGEMVQPAYLDGRIDARNDHIPLSDDLVARLKANGEKHFTLELSIDGNGYVVGGKLLSGNPTLGQELLRQVKTGWQFTLPRVNNTPVQTTIKVYVTF